MSRITLLSVGKIKDRAFSSLEKAYMKRLSHYISLQSIEVKDSQKKDPKEKSVEESERICSQLKTSDSVFILDQKGWGMTSESLAHELQEHYNRGVKNIVFVVGGAYGLSESFKKKAKGLISLSTLTLPHELARVVLLEQLYRAHTIIRGEKYHH